MNCFWNLTKIWKNNGVTFIKNFTLCIRVYVSTLSTFGKYPTTIPALIFASLILANFLDEYLKQFTLLSRAFTNCFISPNLTCKGGNKTFKEGTSEGWITFNDPGPMYIKSMDILFIWTVVLKSCILFLNLRKWTAYAHHNWYT